MDEKFLEELDYLYYSYKDNRDPLMSENLLRSYVTGVNPETGTNDFVENVKQYVNENLNNLPMQYKSDKSGNFEKSQLRNIISVFEALSNIVASYNEDIKLEICAKSYGFNTVEDFLASDEFNSPEDIDYENVSFFEGIDVFNASSEKIRTAYQEKKNEIIGINENTVEQAIRIIERVKSTGALNHIFSLNNWQEMDVESVILALYDYLEKDDELFKIDLEDNFSYDDIETEFFFKTFKELKKNCDSINSIAFEKYRRYFISSRGITADIDKLVFCRNLINFAKCKMMPDYDGVLYLMSDEEDEEKLISALKKTYRSTFDRNEFVNNQGNFIFDIDKSLLLPEKIVKMKATQKDKMFVFGALLKSQDPLDSGYHQYYLLHMIIDDVLSDKTNYEIQLSVIPRGDLKSRAQIVRLDNWKSKQAHKNLANKLATTTHVHLYNMFDILRGKVNGNFDIAFNLEEGNIGFDVALDTFLSMLGNDELKHTLNSKLKKVVDYAKEIAEKEPE